MYGGNWSYPSMSNLGSIIYYRQKLNLTQTIIEGGSDFKFTNLPGRFDHGSYRAAKLSDKENKDIAVTFQIVCSK